MGCFMFASACKNLFVMLIVATALFACRPQSTPHINNPGGPAGQANGATQHHLTLITEPTNASVEILNLETPYRPSLPVKPGIYHLVVSAPGHETVKGYITITDRDWVGRVTLPPLAEPGKKAEKKEESSTPQLEEMRRALQQEQNKLEEARRLLTQEQEETKQARQKLEMEKEALALAKQAWHAQRLPNPPSADKTVGNPTPWGAQPQIDATTLPAQPAARVMTDSTKPPEESPPRKNLANGHATKSPSEASTIEDIIEADETLPQRHTPSLETVPLDQATTLLAEAMAYLQQAPAKQGDPTASKEALRKLLQAQEQDPNNPSIKQALQMYHKRYVIRVASYQQKEGGNALLQQIRSLNIPAFQQAIMLQGESVHRIYIGPFPTREEANKSLNRLPAEIKRSDAIVRIYKK